MYLRAAISACAFLALHSAAWGAFTPISAPALNYRNNTTLVDLAPFGPAPVSSIFDAGLTINFSSLGVVTSAPAIWSSWSAAPESENPGGPAATVPLIAFSITGSFVLTFSAPVSTFGIELQPDVLDVGVPVTATFYQGATPVGQITRTITSTSNPLTGGARLFAGTSLDQPFTSLQISFDTTAAKTDTLGIAYFRYTLAPQVNPVPEPGTVLMVLAGLTAVAWRRRLSL